MKILDIEIPDDKIEKLPKMRRKLLLALMEAHPFAMTTWAMYMAGGTGAPARMKELNNWLLEYGLIIQNERIGGGTWKYWIQDRDSLPMGPKEVIGAVAP